MNVLIIDDEIQLVSLFKDMSTRSNSEICGATTHAEALSLIESKAYDIIICDLNMPDGSGIDFFNSVKDKIGEARFYLLTGDPCISCPEGITRVFQKPGDIQSIIDLIIEQ